MAYVSVVFATKNRAAGLRQVLETYRAIKQPDGGWELIVIDNGSTDGTADVLKDFMQVLPMKVLRHDVPGKNRALNVAIRKAAGDLIVFTDDDTFPRPDWLVQLCRASVRYPEASLFGGTILPLWETPPPKWIFTYGVDLEVAYAITPERPTGPCEAEQLFGPNMAIRSAVFADGTRFDETIGPNGASVYGMGSETEFLTRLKRRGHLSVFVREAELHHLVRSEQLTEAWVLQRAYRHGLGFPQAHPDFSSGRFRIAGVPARCLAIAAAWRLQAATVARISDHENSFRINWQSHWHAGVCDYFATLSRTEIGGPGVAGRACQETGGM